MSESQTEAGEPEAQRIGILRRPLLLVPLGAVVVFGGAFLTLLNRARTGRYNPHRVPNLMVGHPVPPFSVAAAPPGHGFSSASLQHLPAPVLINFFASWCVPCHVENPLLLKLKAGGVPVWGIDYEDQPRALERFLAEDGDPFVRIGADPQGQAAIAFGISGIPESFLIDRRGIIRWHVGGPLSRTLVADALDPLLKKYA